MLIIALLCACGKKQAPSNKQRQACLLDLKAYIENKLKSIQEITRHKHLYNKRLLINLGYFLGPCSSERTNLAKHSASQQSHVDKFPTFHTGGIWRAEKNKRGEGSNTVWESTLGSLTGWLIWDEDLEARACLLIQFLEREKKKAQTLTCLVKTEHEVQEIQDHFHPI